MRNYYNNIVTFFIILLITTQIKAQDNFEFILGEMKTSYAFKGEKKNRASNVELAASKLQNFILQPQEIFSYNDIVGNRTYKTGFKNAPVIMRGELIEGIGGGVCQVSGTVHAAMYLAGMEIVEATQHTRKSSYIDAGFDATVFWKSKDLKVKNTFPFPIKILVEIIKDNKRGYLTIKILGKEEYFLVEQSVIVHHKSKVRVQRIINKNLKKGQYKLIEQGTPEMLITRMRKVYLKSTKELIESTEKKIYYSHSKRIIEVPEPNRK